MQQKQTEGGGPETELRKGEVINPWLQFSPHKAGRSQPESSQKADEDIEISASKFSVLSLDEAEEGEILGEGKQNTETEPEADDEEVQTVESESDLLEDNILDQQVKEKDKDEMKKGKKRGKKAKAQDANPPKSIRSSRRNL